VSHMLEAIHAQENKRTVRRPTVKIGRSSKTCMPPGYPWGSPKSEMFGLQINIRVLPEKMNDRASEGRHILAWDYGRDLLDELAKAVDFLLERELKK
jgi:hypothetical protein